MKENETIEQSSLVERLRDSNERLVLDAIAEIASASAFSEAELEALVECLGASRKAIQRRAADAISSRASSDPNVVSILNKELTSSDARMRWGAAYALGMIPEALSLNALTALVEALADDDGDKRWASADLVVRLGKRFGGEVGKELVALGERGTPNGRKMALYCIRDIGLTSAQVDEVVSNCSGNPDLHVRLAALAALAQLGNAETAAQIAMTMLANDPEPGVRRAAASALGRLGKSGEKVHRLLTDASAQEADPSLRKAAAQALRQIGQQ